MVDQNDSEEGLWYFLLQYSHKMRALRTEMVALGSCLGAWDVRTHVRHVHHHETKQVIHGPSQEKNFKDQIEEEEEIAGRGGTYYTMDDEQWWVQKARTSIHTTWRTQFSRWGGAVRS